MAGWYGLSRFDSFAQPRHETHRQVSCDVARPRTGRANNLGNYIPVLSPDTKTYPGTDYYEIVGWTIHPRRCIPALGPYQTVGIRGRETPRSQVPRRRHRGYARAPGETQSHKPAAGRSSTSCRFHSHRPADGQGGGRARRPDHRAPSRSFSSSWTSDGGPMSWFTNAQNLGGLVHGSAFLNHGPNPGSALYDYPNSQSSRLVWYQRPRLWPGRASRVRGPRLPPT
jgi:hypothetical protein